ncbi:immunoglobulin domain-containing protein [Chitinophagaceae bacterium MMS25-I14]
MAALLLTGSIAYGQALLGYTFSQSSGTYTAITGGTVLGSGSSLDDERFLVTLPFNFIFEGVTYTQVQVSANGYVSFGATDPGSTTRSAIGSTNAGFSLASPYSRDLGGASAASEIRWQATGTSPNRVVTVQWAAMANFFSSTENYNFQVKLYETSNNIDFVYGTHTTTSSSATSGQVGLRGSTNALFVNRTSATNWAATTAGTTNSDAVTVSTTVFPASGLTFTYTPPPACVAPTAQPTVLVLTPGISSVAGSFTAASPVPNKYLVVRTQGASLNTTPVNATNYAAGATLGNGTVVGLFSGTNFTDNNLQSATSYTYTVFSVNDACIGGPLYITTNPLTASTTTNPGNAYTWNVTTGNGDWTVAANWTPARNITDPTDTLYFNNGATTAATNVPAQTVAKIAVANNTNISLSTTAANTLTIGYNLSVTAGSTLNLTGGTSVTLAFAAATPAPTATISGTLNLSGTATCVYNATNSVTTVNGTIAVSGASASVTGSTTSLIFNNGATYNHARNGGTIPGVTYNTGSNVNITGVTTTAPTPPTAIGGNLTWNSPAQTGPGLSFTSTLGTIGGTFNMVNSGSGSFQFGTSPAVTIAGLSTISGGTLNCAGGTLSFNGGLSQSGGTILGSSTTTLNVNGNLNQTGGLITSGTTTASVLTTNVTGNMVQSAAGVISETSTGSLQFTFNGPAIQTVTLNGVDTGILNYRINNTGGINLTSLLKINNGATLTVSNSGSSVTGTGTVQYGATNSALIYNSTTANQNAGAIEWPVTNAPVNVTVNLTGTAPANRLTLPGSRTIGGTLTLTSGLVQLDNNDLTVSNNASGAISVSSPGTARMIAVTGAGQLKRAIGTTVATSYLFPVGDTTGGLDYSPVNLTFASNSAARTIGVKVTDAQHPNDASATNYLSRYWSFSDDGGAAAYTYNGTFTYTSATDVTGTESSIKLNLWNGTAWTQMPSISGTGVLTVVNTPSSATFPLGGNQVTGRPAAATNTYVWNATSGSADWQVPASWTPARNAADPSDVLQFTNGGTSTATNIPTQTVGRIVFSNNTAANFQAPATATLTLASDNSAATNELDIAQGSSLLLNGTAGALTLAFSGTGGTGKIAGNLEVSNTGTILNAINFTNATDTVTSTGTLAAGGTLTTSVFTSTAASLVINGTYNHKYATVGGGAIPTATWGTGSNALISGYTTATGGPGGGMSQTFYNFTYNCPAQTVNNQWAGSLPSTINGTLSILSTGTGQWLWNSGSTGFTTTINNYTQSGGIADLGTGSATSTLNIGGAFNQTTGVLKTSGTGAVTLNYNGATAQTVNFVDSAAYGPIVYRFNNPVGVALTGSGLLAATPNFKINSGGGVRISAAGPVSTALTLVYAATGTTLTYDAASALTATTAIWPATNGPLNMTLNTSGNIVTVPFSRTVAGTLTMTSGDLDITTNTLTLGTSAAATGTLTYTAGGIRTTTGSFVRWYGTTGLPTSAGTSAGFYPLAYGPYNRNVALSFATSTSLSAGGSIAVSHANASGMTTGLSVADGAYTINNRTNASWNFVTSGITLSSTNTINMKLTGTALFVSPTPANLRVMKANAVAGTHVAGSGVSALRNGLVVADLTVPYYIGAANGDINGAYIAVNTGNWSAGSTWDIGTAPGITNDAYINPGVNVTVDAATNAAKSLNIIAGGTLTANTNTLTVDSAIANNGIINVGGGTITVNGGTGTNGIVNNTGSAFNLTGGVVNIGPANGGNKRLTHNAGTIAISGGNLNVNGNMVVSGGTVNFSAGTIKIDGNNNVPSTSVASGAHLLDLSSVATYNVTGGTFLIVDPPITGTGLALRFSGSGANASFAGNTVQFGATSTDTSNATNGFNFDTWVGSARLLLGHVIVNGGSANSHFVSGSTSSANGADIGGNLTINSGSELRTISSGSSLRVGGNIVNNGTLTLPTTLIFSSLSGSTTASSLAAQSMSGSGLFRNAVSATPTANFSGITLQNPFGVTMNTGNISFSGTITFNTLTTPGKLIMPGTTILSEITGAGTTGASQTNGWVYGTYQKAASAGTLTHTYPIGDANYFTPVQISGGTGAVATAGTISASTTSVDHPSVNSSTINPTKSVNRYYTITPGNGLTFAAGALTTTFNWNAADVDAGANTANFKIGSYASSAWSYPATASAAATSIQGTGVTIAGATDFEIGEQCAAINITSQTLAHTLCVGNADTFKVALTGTSGVRYQWQKNGVNITGATNAAYIIPAVATTDTGNYTVVLTSDCASVTSVTSPQARLNINIPPAVTTQPVSQAICENSPVTFSVTVTGTAPTPYQWQKNGSDISGATNATYTIASVTPADAGNYTVIVGGAAPCASTTSNAAVLTVKPLPLNIIAASTTTFCAGSSVALKASSLNTLTYTWKQNGTPIVPAATDSVYTASTSGSYTVTIINTANACSGTSNAITVTANGAPTSTITPSGTVSFCAGGSILLHGLNAGGLTYEWAQNGTPIPSATDSTYTATAAGSYTVKVSIGAGCSNTSVPTVVSVNPLPPTTITAGGPLSFCPGGNVSLCAPSGYGYQWKLNTSIIPGATNQCYTATASGNYTVTVTNLATGCVSTTPVATVVTVNPAPTVTVTAASATTFCEGGSVILNASPTTGLGYSWNRNGNTIAPPANTASYIASQSGNYTLTVTDLVTGCQNTSTATVVTVNPAPIVTVTVSNGTTICQGQSTNLCVPTGANLHYQWYVNNAAIASATNACYATTQAGSYTVTVTNTVTNCSATSASTTIVVNPVPVATATVQGAATACQGDTVWISGAGGPGYIWNKNGAPIPGATNQLYGATTSGIYSVTTTNSSNCSTTSANVTVTINPKPTVIITYTTPITFCDGGAVVLDAVSSNGVTYQWQNNGAALSGETNNYYIASSTGAYTVTVTNGFGCSTTAATPTLVISNPLPQPQIIRNGNILSTGSYATYQWYLNTSPINNAVSQSYACTQNGAYSVRVTDANNCTNYSTITFVNNVGVKNVTIQAADIKVYPNPARQLVNIDAPVKVNIVVRDLQGRVILEQKDAKQVDLGQVADGLYMMQISDTDGHLLKVEKLQKQ